MNRPTGLEFGYYTTKFLLWEVTWQTIGWEYDRYITTKDIVRNIEYVGFKSQKTNAEKLCKLLNEGVVEL